MLEQKGTIKTISAVEEVGRDKKYNKQTVVLQIENGTGQYARTEEPAFTFFGKSTEKLQGITEGQVATITFELKGREHNGKYYNELNATGIAISR